MRAGATPPTANSPGQARSCHVGAARDFRCDGCAAGRNACGALAAQHPLLEVESGEAHDEGDQEEADRLAGEPRGQGHHLRQRGRQLHHGGNGFEPALPQPCIPVPVHRRSLKTAGGARQRSSSR